MATNGASGAWRRRSRQNNSISPITSTPACCAASTVQCGAGWVSGAPGVSTRAAKFAHETLRRSAVMNPACAASASRSTPASLAITPAPPAFKAWQLASPDPPRPNTATVLPAKDVTGIMVWHPSFRGVPTGRRSAPPDDRLRTNPESRDSGLPLRGLRNDDGEYTTYSPQLQGGEAGQRQHHRDDPEPDHDLRFGPALLLKMVMDRRHPEHALAGELERHYLHDHRDRLQHEQSADHREHDLVFDRDRDRSEHAAKRQRSGVAHEDRCRRRVEPQESQSRAQYRAAQHREFARAGDVIDLQVIREHGVADEICDHAEACRRNHHRDDGKAIETVGQVDRIAGADNDEGAEHHEEPAEIQHHVLEEWNHQGGRERVASEPGQRVAGGEREDGFDRKPEAAGEAAMALLGHLQIIVVEADEAETQRYRQHDPDIGVDRIGPQQR